MTLPCYSAMAPLWEMNEQYIVTIAEGVHAHPHPDVESKAPNTYRYGDEFIVLDRVHIGGNEFLETDAGWVNAACRHTSEHVADRVFVMDPELYVCTSSTGLPVQSGRSSSSSEINVIQYGETFRVFERTLESGVIRLRVGDEGWVSGVDVQDGSMIAEPVVPKTPEQHIVDCPRGLLLRSSFNLSSEMVGWMQMGEIFDVLERKVLNDGTMRLRSAGGWTSQKSSSGASLLTRGRSAPVPGVFNTSDFSTSDITEFDNVTQRLKELFLVSVEEEEVRVAYSMQRKDSVWRYNPCNGKPMGMRENPNMEAAKTGSFLFPGDNFAVDQIFYDNAVQFLHLADGSGWVFDQTPTCTLCEQVSG